METGTVPESGVAEAGGWQSVRGWSWTDLTGLCNEEVFSPSHPMKRLWVLKGRVVCLEARRPLEILETKRERC